MNLYNMKTKDFVFTFMKGILLGLISMGIPGLSASTIGIILGVYYLMVEAISNIIKDFKHNFPFLITIILGYAVGSAGAAFSVTILFDRFPLATTLVILGMIFGSIPDLILDLKGNYNKISGWIVFTIICAILISYNFCFVKGTDVEFPTEPSLGFLIKMMIIGLVTSSTFVIPGIDFALVFLALGLYRPFMNMLTDLLTFSADNYLTIFLANGKIMLFYLVGYYVGVFFFSKLIKFLTKKYETQTKFATLAFIISAPVIVVKNCIIDNDSFKESIPQMVVGFILASLSFLVIFYLGIKHRKDRLAKTKDEKQKIEEISLPPSIESSIIEDHEKEKSAN